VAELFPGWSPGPPADRWFLAKEPVPFNPTGGDADELLALLAWCATVAGVAGLMIVGIKMALQLNRGVAGEESEHYRGFFFVIVACLLAASAGPIVTFLFSPGI
jgi:hypothetical protein